MEPREILELPIFPKHNIVVTDDEVQYSSAVYLHYDKERCVEVLLQPVVHTFILSKGVNKQKFLEHHLKHCLVVSKYTIVSPEYKEQLPCIDTIFKDNPNFLSILHNTYP